MVFQWSLSDSKSRQVSRTFLSILADLNNALVGMVSNCHANFESSSPFFQTLWTDHSSPITICISISLILNHVLILWQGLNTYNTPGELYLPRRLMIIFQCSLSDCKSRQIFWTSFTILADLHNEPANQG